MRFARLLDGLSPILVKELRQGRRSRALILLGVLTMVAAAMISLYAIGGGGGGRDVFFALYLCLSIVGFLIFPLMAHRSFVREQEDGSWQILQLTGLGPRRILAGKLASSLVQVAILSAGVAPFLLLSHFLARLDLLTIGLLCLSGAVMAGALTMFALFVATLPGTRAQRSVAQIVLMVALFMGMSSCMLMVNDVGRRGVPTHDLLIPVWAVFGSSYTLFEAAAARMALPTEDYAWRPRRALILQLVALTAFGIWQHLVDDGFNGKMCHMLAVLIIGAGAFGMAFEADAAGPARRRRFSLLAPGALSGLRLTVVLLAASTVLWAWLRPAAADDVAVIVAAPSYLVLYLCAALWASWAWRARQGGAADASRFAFLAITGLGVVVPWVIAKSFGGDLPETFWPGYVSPLVGLPAFDATRPLPSHEFGHWVLLALAIAAFVATDRMLARRRRAIATASAVASKPHSDGSRALPA